MPTDPNTTRVTGITDAGIERLAEAIGIAPTSTAAQADKLLHLANQLLPPATGASDPVAAIVSRQTGFFDNQQSLGFTGASTALTAAAVHKYVTGQHPYEYTHDTLTGLHATDTFTTPAARTCRATITPSGITAHIRDGDIDLLVEWELRATRKSTSVHATAATPDAFSPVAAALATIEAAADSDGDDQTVVTHLWTASPHGMTSRPIFVTVPDTTTTLPNYPTTTRATLAGMFAADGPPTTGRLAVWYGPPGTGKTTAALALADAWSDWCEPHLVADPDALLASTANMLDVTTDEGDHWKLVIIEDADAFLEITTRTSSPISRLLNICDGILGQGSRTLFLLTANLTSGQMNPAVTRPGRAFNVTEFAKHTRSEANDWYRRNNQPAAATDSMSLAELLAATGTLTTPGNDPAPATNAGVYL